MDYNKNYYGILGIKPAATQEEIRKAYRVLAKQYHPDKQRVESVRSEKFAVIKEAYDVLSDPVAKIRYDAVFLRDRIGPYQFSRHTENAEKMETGVPVVTVKKESTNWIKPLILIIIAIIAVALIIKFAK